LEIRRFGEDRVGTFKYLEPSFGKAITSKAGASEYRTKMG
jgi:hypothetical protein